MSITNEDYIEREFTDRVWHIEFSIRKVVTKLSELLIYLKQVFSSNTDIPSIYFLADISGRIIIGCDKQWSIIHMSHRVRLLLGAFNDQFTIKSILTDNGYRHIFGAPPMYNYGNILYLMSRNATITGTNKKGQ
jgi:hypothetical protein